MSLRLHPLRHMTESTSSTDAAVQILKDEGNRLFKEGQVKQAIKKYKEGISLHESPALYTNRAACYVKLDRFRDAIRDCDTALAIDGLWARAYIRKAECHLHLKEPDDAVDTLTQGLEASPSNKEMKSLLRAARAESLQMDRRARSDVSLFVLSIFLLCRKVQ